MSEFREVLILIGKRMLIGIPLIAVGVIGGLLLEKTGSSPLGVLAIGLFCCASILMGAIVLAQPLARLLAEPFGSLFWSNKYYDKPQPRFSIPEARRREGKYEEALTGYATIIVENPEAAVRAYIEMFNILIVDLKDADRADALYLEALDELKKKPDRELLAKVYRDVRSRIATNRNGIPERAPINTDGMHRSKPRT